MIVASDGAKSIIRNKLKFSTLGYDYNETGLVCTLRGNKSSETAYQRFLSNGVVALLPLYDNLYSIVCSMPKNINNRLMQLEEKQFVNLINRIFHDSSEIDNISAKIDKIIPYQYNFSSPPIMDKILSDGKRMEFPLQLMYVTDPVYKKVALIGDAGHAIHPMAGQGLNLGIADSAILANEIISGLKLGRRLNDRRTLESFSSKSQINTKIMLSLIESLKFFFNKNDLITTEIRNFGMTLCNKSSLIKSLFMNSASGELLQPKFFAWEDSNLI